MKHLGLAALTILASLLIACGGSSSNNTNVNGNWTASLTNVDGTPAFDFTISLSQSSGTDVSGTNLTFSTSNACFVSGSTATGGFTLTGNSGGVVTGNFELTIQSGAPSGNVLTLQGTLTNNTISGTWSLTGVTQGCTGNGNFTMTRM